MGKGTEEEKEEICAGKEEKGLGPQAAGGAKEPEDEEKVRRRAFIWLGVVLLVAFFLPVLDSDLRLVSVNITTLMGEGVPAILWFWCLYPALAGIATILLAIHGRGLGRSVAFICMGLLPFGVLSGVEAITEAFRGQGLGGPLATQTAPILVGFLGALGMVGIYAGSRARCFRPESRAAAIVGAVSGGVYLLSVLLPTVQVGYAVASPLLISLSLIFGGQLEAYGLSRWYREELWGPDVGVRIFVGVMALAQVALLVAAAIVCLRNATARPDAARRARRAFTLWGGSLGAVGGAALGSVIYMTAAEEVPGSLVPGLFVLVKIGLWVVGMLLLVAMGATDMVLSVSPARAAAVAAVPAPPIGEEAHRRLASLKKMLNDGLISQQDYDRKKDEILSKM